MSDLSVTVGILSIGEMGLGIAELLVAHKYRVVTNLEGRSEDTKTRASKASIQDLGSDTSLVSECDYILSIVPPRDALATAQRIITAFNSLSPPKSTPLYYFDLNAISPRSARSIATLFSTSTPTITFLDGGIIGGAPRPKSSDSPEKSTSPTQSSSPGAWSKPSIPISGPLPSSLPKSWTGLKDVLELNHISEDVGTASGLKCCFATTTKGIIALCLQAFTTAGNLGVLPLLLKEMEERTPGVLRSAGGVTRMPPKAYRWVREMEEIAQTHSEEGGFSSSARSGDTSSGVFHEIAELYRIVAEDTVLGEEKTDKRKRGLEVEDVAAAMGEGLKERAKRAKKE